MSNIKRLMEDLMEREEEIQQVLKQANKERPAFYELVIKMPNKSTVGCLLRGITTDESLIRLVAGYLCTQIKS